MVVKVGDSWGTQEAKKEKVKKQEKIELAFL